VGDHDDGAAGRQRLQGLAEPGRTGRIQVRGRFVEQQQRRVPQERPRQRDLLPLPRRQRGRALAKGRVIAGRPGLDEPGGPGKASGPADRVVARTAAAEGDVLRGGAGEQVGPLRHPGDLGTPSLRIQFGQVRAAHRDRSRGLLYQPEQQGEQRALTGTAGPVTRIRSPGETQRHTRSRAGRRPPG